MATDEERLLVRIEAQMRQFERAMKQAAGSSERTARKIQRDFSGMERGLSNVGRGLARSLVGPLAALGSAREIGQAIDAFTRIQNSLKVAGLEGDALEAVFDRLFATAQQNAAPIEALANLYSRVSLVQKELGVSTEEMLHFTEGVAAALRVSGRSAAESSGALLQLSQALGSGVIRAEEFNSVLEGALPIAQAAARGLEEAGGSVAKLRQLVIDGAVSSEAFFRAFEAGQGSLEKLASTTDVTLAGAWTRLQNTLVSSVGRLNEAYDASGTLAGGLDWTARAVGRLADALIRAQGPLNEFIEKARGLRSMDPLSESVERANVRVRELGATLPSELGRVAGAFEAAEVAAAGINNELEIALQKKAALSGGDLIALPQKTVSLQDFEVPDAGKADAAAKRVAKARDTAAAAALREQEAITELIAELEREQSLIGASEVQKRISNELRQAGAAASEEQKQRITDLVTAIEAEEAAQQALVDRMDTIRDAAGGALSSFNSSLQQGTGLVGALDSALESVLSTLSRIVEQAIISGLFGQAGTPGGGILSAIAGGLGGGGSTLPGGSPMGAGGIGHALRAVPSAAPRASVPQWSLNVFEAPGAPMEAKMTPDGRGGGRIDVVAKQMTSAALADTQVRRNAGLPLNIRKRGRS